MRKFPCLTFVVYFLPLVLLSSAVAAQNLPVQLPPQQPPQIQALLQALHLFLVLFPFLVLALILLLLLAQAPIRLLRRRRLAKKRITRSSRRARVPQSNREP